MPASPAIPNFQPKAVLKVNAGPGTFDFRIYPIGANPQADSPVISVLGATIPATGELSVVAHLDGQGQTHRDDLP